MKTKVIAAIMVTMLVAGLTFYIFPVKAPDPIKIGVIGPVGWPQMTGMVEGAVIAAEWINDPAGGDGINIGGTKYNVELHFANEHAVEPDPAAGAAEMDDLITLDECDFIYGGFRTECTTALRTEAVLFQNLYTICGSATNELIDCGGAGCGACVRCDYNTYKYIFRNTPINNTMLFYNILAFLSGYVVPFRLAPTYGAPIRTAVITESLAWTVTLWNLFTNFGAGGTGTLLGPQVNVVMSSSARTPYPTTDFSSYLTQMDNDDIRLVIQIYSGPCSTYLVPQMMAVYKKPKAALCGIDVVAQTTELWVATGGAIQYEAFLATTGTRSPISTVAQPYTTEQFWDIYYAHSPVWIGDLGVYAFDTPHAPIYTTWGVYDSIIALHSLLEANNIHPPFNQNAGGRADQLIPLIEATNRNGIVGKFKYTQYHDPYSIEFGSTWPLGYIRAFWTQWQAGRLEVVWPSAVAYSKLWALPRGPGQMYPYPQDVNQDGTVNIFDALIVAGAWWTEPQPPDQPPDPTWQMVADIGGPAGPTTPDNTVNMIDLVSLKTRYGQSVSRPLDYCNEGGWHVP